MMDRELREKIIVAGAEILSDKELLCAVMQTEASDDSIRISELLMSEFGTLADVASSSIAQLRKVSGCGIARALRITVAAELCRRIRETQSGQVQSISSDKDVVRIFDSFAHLPHEEFWVLFLTSSGRIIDKVKISQGGVSGTVVDYKLIVKQAVMLLADSMILVHNHPSGTPQPSKQDYEITKRITDAAALFDIRILDHIIISSSGHFSMSSNGCI